MRHKAPLDWMLARFSVEVRLRYRLGEQHGFGDVIAKP
jgi:hypothetical protein